VGSGNQVNDHSSYVISSFFSGEDKLIFISQIKTISLSTEEGKTLHSYPEGATKCNAYDDDYY
jgi:hypothetical protein